LEETIVVTPNSLGITGISSARLRYLKLIHLDGMALSYENIKSGQYQLHRPLYITYNDTSKKRADVKNSSTFVTTEQAEKL